MRVLVTGANGFVGKEVCKELSANGFEIIKFISTNKPFPKQEDSAFKVYRIDITDFDLNFYKKEIEKVDAVIHIAGLAHQFGETPAYKFDLVNVKGSENIAKLAVSLQAKRFINISSVSVYGDCVEKKLNEIVTEESVCQPIDDYAKSKFEAENICIDILSKTDTKLMNLRLATVIGEEDRGNVLRLIKLIDSRKFFWVGNGQNKKSLIHKNDVGKAILKVLQSNTEKENQIFNIASSHITIKEIVGIISNELGKRIIPIAIPSKLLINILNFLKLRHLKKLESSLKKWVAEDVYSSEKFSNKFNFNPSVPIEEALVKEVKWYKKNKP